MADLFEREEIVPIPVSPPNCDCCAKPECVHETITVCDDCGEEYPSGDPHECVSIIEEIARSDERVEMSTKRILEAAWRAVRHYGDKGDDDQFGEIMTDLARVLAEEERA